MPPPPFVTIEEDEEELVICLHLPLSETSPAQRSFASSRIRSLTQQVSEPGKPLPIDSIDEPQSQLPRSGDPFERPRSLLRGSPFIQRAVDPDPFPKKSPLELDVGLVQPRRGPGKETIIAILDEALGKHPRPLGGIIGGLSRGIGNLLFGTGIDPRSGVSLSQQLAELTNQSIGEVHIRLLLPFIGEPGLGKDFSKALIDDFRRMARDGDVQGLEGIVELLGGTQDRIQGIISSQTSPGAVFGDAASGSGRASTGAGRGLLVFRSDRALKGVKDLKRQAELSLQFAERVQEAP